jgi:hypothetical protein
MSAVFVQFFGKATQGEDAGLVVHIQRSSERTPLKADVDKIFVDLVVELCSSSSTSGNSGAMSGALMYTVCHLSGETK